MSTKGTGTEGLDHLFGRPTGRRNVGVAPAGQSSGALNPSLRDILRQFDDANREAQRMVEGLSDRQFNWRPASGRWSIAECYGHLNIVGSEMLPVIDDAVAEARARAWYSNDAFRPRLVGRLLLKATEPPVRHRRRAREHHVPASDQFVKDVLPALVDLNRVLASRVQAANGLDLSRPRVSAPATTIFRLSLFELFLFLAAHGRRHLRQARAVREHPLFPRAPAGPEHGRPSSPAVPHR
ncbi:MAG: DinB family protein [Acidobacteriia bacterium]|nr:DinB family protein [Terriglobia bacterium]